MIYLFISAFLALLLLIPADTFHLHSTCGLNINVLCSRHMISTRPRFTDSSILKASRCDHYATQLRTISKTRNPLWEGVRTLLAYANGVVVGLLCVVIMRVLNKFTSHRLSLLLDLVFNREAGKGLLTVSNHQSVFDDPGIWGAAIPFWRLKPSQLRWVLCTEDVFFAIPWLKWVFELGNVLPLDRGGSIEQPSFHLFHVKLAQGAWCHIFPEGRVWQNWRFDTPNERVLGPFKYGVGKLIAHSYPNVPFVLPVYHKGMSNIIPEVQLSSSSSASPQNNVGKPNRRKAKASKPLSIIPRRGNPIEMFVGTPVDFTEDIKEFNALHPGLLESWTSTLETIRLYEQITDKIRVQMEILEAEAYGRDIVVQPKRQEMVAMVEVTAVSDVSVASAPGPVTVGASIT